MKFKNWKAPDNVKLVMYKGKLKPVTKQKSKCDVISFVCLNGKEPIDCPIFDIQKKGCHSCNKYVQANN